MLPFTPSPSGYCFSGRPCFFETLEVDEPPPLTHLHGVLLTSPGSRAPVGFAARTAGGVAAGLAQGPTEMFIHHRADVPLEVGEEHASGVDILSFGWALLLWAALLFLDAGRGLVGKGGVPAGAAAAGAGVAFLGFLHFRVVG